MLLLRSSYYKSKSIQFQSNLYLYIGRKSKVKLLYFEGIVFWAGDDSSCFYKKAGDCALNYI